MSSFELQFASPWPLLLFIPAAAAVVWSYSKVRGMNPKSVQRALPMALRLLTIALVTLFLSGFTILTNKVNTALLILADRSDSMVNVASDVEARANEIAQHAAQDVRVGVISFAGDQSLEQPFAKRPGNIALSASQNGSSTNIAEALSAAKEALPGNMLQRIVLLTDGIETDGDAVSAAETLAGQGVRIDAMQFDTAITGPEVEVTALHLPADAVLGQSFQAGVTIASNTESSGTLRLYEEDTLIKEEPIHILSGENTYTYDITPTGSGIRVISAMLEPEEDTLAQNNQLFGSLDVTSGSAILIVDGTGQEGKALQTLLSDQGYDARVTVCQQFPRTISALCQYGLIILMNVDSNALPPASADLLDQYIWTYGRSVLTTGGENTYIFGNMKETRFEDFLPITMEVEEQESAEAIALLLLIDNSASMEGTAISMAKHGAIKSINSLNQNDYVGVITFSTDFEVLSELTSMEHKSEVIAAVSGLGTIMGTMYGGALQEAHDQLTAFDKAEKKHVIFLSDGNPSDTGFEAIIQEMAEQNITTSTIAVGKSVSAARMEKMAETGGGHFYKVTSAHELPSIMMTDAILQRVEYKSEKTFIPTVGTPAFTLPDAASMPPLYGYIRAAAKSAADVALYADKNRPLYLQWGYGTGRAASFLSDLNGRWSSGWFQADEGRRVILSMIESLLADEYRNAAIRVSLERGGAESVLRVTSADAVDGQTFTADITAPDASQYTVVLTPMGDGVFERGIPITGFGKYGIILRQYDAEGALLSTLNTAATVSWSAEYEAFTKTEDLGLLWELCALTGGTVWENVEQMLDVSLEKFFVKYDPKLPMAMVVFFAMLMDIVIRKVKFKRVRRLFMKASKKDGIH